ncbi:MAG: ABC transporter permease [Acidobacteriota bacterium]
MRAYLLALLLALHPASFRSLLAADLRHHFAALSAGPQWRMLLDLTRNLPGVYADQLRIRRSTLGGLSRPEAPMFEMLARDFQFAIRRLLRAPTLTAAATLTLALGIGGTAAIFSLINGVFLEPFSAPESHRLVDVHELSKEGRSLPLSYESYLDYKNGASSFEHLGILRAQSVNVTGGGRAPERIRGLFVTASLFEVLDEPMALGRGLADGEDIPGGTREAVISYGFWQRRFGGAVDVLGQTIELNNEEHAIVGVMGAAHRFPYDRTEAWISLQTFPGSLNRTNRTLFTIGRLRDGVSLEQARAELQSIALGLTESRPDTHRDVTAGAEPLVDSMTGTRTQTLLGILLAAVATVLLIGAANVANLQLAQATGRGREMAVRTAVGASRRRLLTQVIIENLTLALFGGIVGIGVAYGGVALLQRYGPGWLGGLYSISPDLRVYLFALLVTALTGLAFGLLPAHRAGRADLVGGLKDGGRGSGPARRSGRLRGTLVIAQTALATMLIIGAGLLVRSFSNLQSVDLGFKTEGLMTVQFRLPANKYESNESVVAFFEHLLEKVEALPGVEAAAVAIGMPFTGDDGRARVLADGVDPGETVEVPMLYINSVSRSFFDTLEIPHLAGRTFDKTDVDGALQVAVINDRAADELWPEGEDPVGRTVGFHGLEDQFTVIGVVGSIYGNSLRDGPDPVIYLVNTQDPVHFSTLAARVPSDPYLYGPKLQQAIWDLDPNQPVWEIVSQTDRIGGSLGSDRFVARLLAFFAGIALLLAAIGIGGVVAYAVALRKRELGIRLSLGATPRTIVHMIVSQGLLLVVAGLALGVLGAAALQRLMEAFLFGVDGLDPLSFGAAPLVLLLVGLLASAIPAWRASGINPVTTLRDD